MPPIQIHSHSSINAAKADGVTPQTAPPDDQPPTRASAASTHQGYPPAQPGAVPRLPAPTGAATAERYAPSIPTPTQKPEDHGPPPPQPGAVPVAPGAAAAAAAARTALPPPPKAGEKYHPPEVTAAPQAPASMPYPAQMAVPAPTMPRAQRGTSTAAGGPGASPSAAGGSLPHPQVGYQQNVNASGFGPGHQGYLNSSPGVGSESEEGVWDAAKKLVQQAGERLSAAETDIWRRINKE